MTQKNNISFAAVFARIGLADAIAGIAANSFVSGIANPAEAKPGEISFLASEAYLEGIEAGHATALFISEALKEKLSAHPGLVNAGAAGTKIIYVKDAMLAFAQASELFSPENALAAGIHASAIIHPQAQIGRGVEIGPNVVVGAGARIGDNVKIHAQVIIGNNVVVGAGSILFPTVILYDGVRLGERVRIHASSVIGADGFGYVQKRIPDGVEHIKIHHLGSVRIDSDVEIGANSSVDRGTLGDTIIEAGCKIDNHVQIGHNCHIEKGVIICGVTGVAGSAHVGKFSVLAGFVGVANKTKIGAGAIVAAFSMVFGKVPAGAKWGGVPARSSKEYFRLQVLISRLPELFAAVKLENRKNAAKEIEE